jgi:hypothetical protein
MASIGQILSRTFFWTYERGTWQYDLAVVLILIFVLLTPRRWFNEQPQVGVTPYPGEVQHLATPAGPVGVDTYRVDARLLAPPVQTPALENDLHNALKKTSPELTNGRFAITKIEAVRDAGGTVIAYDVEVHR